MKKKAIATLLCGVFCMTGAVTPCLAAEYHDPTTAEVPVSFEQDSTFTVTLPENVTGDSGATSADFTYSVKGDIASDESVVITLDDADASTDGAQVVMKDILNNEKYATVAIDKTSYTYDEITGTGMENNGTATFDDLTAGSWSGTAKFVIDLQNN